MITNKALIQGGILIVITPIWMRIFWRCCTITSFLLSNKKECLRSCFRCEPRGSRLAQATSTVPLCLTNVRQGARYLNVSNGVQFVVQVCNEALWEGEELMPSAARRQRPACQCGPQHLCPPFPQVSKTSCFQSDLCAPLLSSTQPSCQCATAESNHPCTVKEVVMSWCIMRENTV